MNDTFQTGNLKYQYIVTGIEYITKVIKANWTYYETYLLSASSWSSKLRIFDSMAAIAFFCLVRTICSISASFSLSSLFWSNKKIQKWWLFFIYSWFVSLQCQCLWWEFIVCSSFCTYRLMSIFLLGFSSNRQQIWHKSKVIFVNSVSIYASNGII